MPDDPKPETPAEEPTPDPKTAEPKADDKPTGKDGTPFDPDRAQAALEKARDAEKRAKQEAKDLREKAQKYDELTEAQKSDLEKANARAEAAEAKAGEADGKLKRANLIAALSQPEFGIVNARAAAKLIDGVEYDDEGEPTNLGSPDEDKSLIAAFLSTNDFLRGKPGKPKPPSTDAREGGNGKTPELTAEELEAAKKSGMEPEEYAIFKSGGSLADLKEAGLVTDPK